MTQELSPEQEATVERFGIFDRERPITVAEIEQRFSSLSSSALVGLIGSASEIVRVRAEDGVFS